MERMLLKSTAPVQRIWNKLSKKGSRRLLPRQKAYHSPQRKVHRQTPIREPAKQSGFFVAVKSGSFLAAQTLGQTKFKLSFTGWRKKTPQSINSIPPNRHYANKKTMETPASRRTLQLYSTRCFSVLFYRGYGI